jgi:hypothetical protein
VLVPAGNVSNGVKVFVGVNVGVFVKVDVLVNVGLGVSGVNVGVAV